MFLCLKIANIVFVVILIILILLVISNITRYITDHKGKKTKNDVSH